MSQTTDGPSADTPVGIYDLGFDYNVEIEWFPALREKFGDQHIKIAMRIGDEIEEIGSFMIFMHRFSFEDEQIMIASHLDEDRKLVSVDADLVSRQEEIGTLDHDGKEKRVLMPVSASQTKKKLD